MRKEDQVLAEHGTYNQRWEAIRHYGPFIVLEKAMRISGWFYGRILVR